MIGGVSRRTSSQVFVGRNAELGRLDEALAQATDGRPSMVLVAGEAGIGKTRFVSEFLGRAEAGGALTALGGCLDVADGGLPYAPFAEAFRALARQLGPAIVPEVFGRSSDLVGGLTAGARRSSAAFADAGRADFEDPAQRLARLFDAVIGALGRLSTERPLVLVLEDLHWADGSTRDLIRFLARNIRDERLLLVATYRSDDMHRRHPVMPLLAELARSPRVERIDLTRFDRREVDALLTGILGHAPDESLGDELLQRSDGLPFYVEELVASASADGRELPSNLRDILEGRLVVLSPDALAVVRTAAVIGANTTHARLATVSGLDPGRLLEALREVADRGILTPADGAGGPTYRFRHALLREAAYDDLLPAERVRLHGEMADLLEASIRSGAEPGPATLADFALHAYLAHDLPRALEGSCRAMSAFVSAAAFREALTHAERALELWPRVDDAAHRAGMDHSTLLANTGRLAAAASQPVQATALLQEAIAELDEGAAPADRIELLIELQAAAWEAEAYDISRMAAEAAFELDVGAEPSDLTVEVMVLLSVERWWSGRLRESVSLLEDAMALAARIGATARWAEAGGFLAHVRSDLGQGVWASDLIDRAVGADRDSSHLYSLIGSEIDRSLAALTCGRFADAEQFAVMGLEDAIRYGLDGRQGPHLRCCLVDALFELGRYDEAESVAQQARHSRGISHSLNWMAATMCRVAVARGRTDEAHRILDTAPDATGRDAALDIDPFDYVEIAGLDLARAEGRFADVVAIVDGFVDAIETTESVMPTWQALAIGIGACAEEATAARRRRRPTADIIGQAERWYGALAGIGERVGSEGGGGPWFDATVATSNAEMGRSNDHPDRAAWAAVVDQWVALHHPFQAAYARLRLAETLLRTTEDRSLAEVELRTAHAAARSIGAGLLLAEMETLATDARIDLKPGEPLGASDAAGPTSALTPRELAVIRLVAEGHTNREIGDQLFISEKTVSVHVSNAMSKLGALSRYEAAASAQRHGLL